ncbi:hypothetical protein PMAYCL1PPCAC_26890, partial [Pristionchus mayeri]
VFNIYSTDLPEKFEKFEMTVSVNLVYAIPDSFESKSSLVNIYSGSLKVGDSIVPVSKEMLAVTSPFFNVLFYGNFGERRNDIFEIKEVETEDFLWFINSIHSKKWFCMSVNQALVTLCFSDRFGMLNLHKHVSAYLKFYSLAKEDIKDALIICSRFDNEELIVWVLAQCETPQDRFDRAIECAPFGDMSSVSVLKVLKETFLANSSTPALTGLTECLVKERDAPIHLRCYGANDILEYERYFSLELDADGDFKWDRLRSAISSVYGRIYVDGEQKWPRPDRSDYCQVRSPRIVEVIAYRT